MKYRKELEHCFRVVKKAKNGKEYTAWPRPAQKQEGTFEESRPDRLRAGISDAPPGSDKRIEDLAKYYEEQENEVSPFDGDLAFDLCTALEWFGRKSKNTRMRDVLIERSRSERSELED